MLGRSLFTHDYRKDTVIGESIQTGGSVSLDNVMRLVMERLDRASQGMDQGLLTGYADIDRLIGGMHPGQLIILAARPSMGKTTLASSIALHVSESTTVLFHSLETKSDNLGIRQLSADSGIGHGALRSGKLTNEQWTKVSNTSARLASLPIRIDDTAAITVAGIRSRARRMKRKTGLGLIIIDYLQQLRGPGNGRYEVVSNISRDLKALPMELSVPVIALAQLNRATVGGGGDKRPQLEHLKESGQIEQDADIVAMLHREEYYEPETYLQGIAELIIRKNRDGETGTVYLTSQLDRVRFQSFAGPLPKAPEKLCGGGFEYNKMSNGA